jgi:hypothetical protein
MLWLSANALLLACLLACFLTACSGPSLAFGIAIHMRACAVPARVQRAVWRPYLYGCSVWYDYAHITCLAANGVGAGGASLLLIAVHKQH